MKKKVIYIVLIMIILINCGWLVFNLYYCLASNKRVLAPTFRVKLLGNRVVEVGLNKEYKEEGGSVLINEKEYPLEVEGVVNTEKVGTYLLKYKVKDDYFKEYSTYRIVQVVDNEAPIIELNGSSKVIVTLGQAFNETGVVVTDNSGEDLSSKVVIEGNINTEKLGTYTITYSVADSSGNIAKVQRKVVVQKQAQKTSGKKKKEVVIKTEKGQEIASKLDLNKDSNTTITMSFTKTGIHMEGYVKQGSGTYTIELCDNDFCATTNTKTREKYYYTGEIDLTTLKNGTYQMKVTSKNSKMDVINKLVYSERIVRAKVDDKLVTVEYGNNKPKIKIEDFAYEYDILIDAGHGGIDSGAENKKGLEKDLNLKQSLYEKERYEQHGLKVKMIRTDDTYGIMMGPSSEALVRRRAYAIGYYGAVSRYVYSNHHNSITNNYYSGWEIIVPAKDTAKEIANQLTIANEWKKAYKTVSEDHVRVYGRNYTTGTILNKISGTTYDVRNWYAIIRIPYELYNVHTTLYEGCYMSNNKDYNWYIENWKTLSEIKIKTYVESLGKTYIPV